MKNIHVVNQHIYITSSEEIKQGDWCIYNSGDVIQYLVKLNTDNLKKIILTTDQDLIKDDGVQAIDDDFLEWFVKNPDCEIVEVQKGFADGTAWGYNFLDYKIIIPSEKPKQETLEEAAYQDCKKSGLNNTSYAAHCIHSFINGAKWQAERMYSEEDLLSAFEAGMMFIGEDKGSFKEWYEQFKKKQDEQTNGS